MKRENALFLAVIFTITIFLEFRGRSFAYLDPGTGSVILQGIIAAIAAALVAIKLNWHRLLRFFGIRKGAGEDNTSGQNSKKE